MAWMDDPSVEQMNQQDLDALAEKFELAKATAELAEYRRAKLSNYPTRLARFRAALTSDDEMPEFHP